MTDGSRKAIGEAAGTVERDAIVEAIEGADRVKRLIHVRTQHLEPDVHRDQTPDE